MGMGFMGSSITALFHEDMKMLFPKECEELEQVLDEQETGIDEFFEEFNDAGGPDNYTDEQRNAIEPKLEALQKAFTAKYPKLDILPFFHYEDDGDRYDDFFGGAWEVNGVFEKTDDARAVELDLGNPGALDMKSIVFYG